MEKCLVTKLKAVVNNPDLPYLEIMQQFTLDAITASGNTALSDEQKWALNHFFYRIGAITDSGIYSKLQVLALPFIAVSLDTALNNYIQDGSSFADKDARATFADGALGSSLSSGTLTICSYAATSGKDNNSFLFVAGDARPSSKIITDSRTYSAAYNGTNNVASLDSSPYTQYSTVASSTLSGVISLIAFNIETSAIKLCYADGDSVNKVVPGTLHTGELLGEDVNSFSPIATPSTQLKGFAYGSGLTEDEALEFAKAYHELTKSF